jgi:hypothetical protein
MSNHTAVSKGVTVGAVRNALKAAGWRPHSDRNREGVRVTAAGERSVRVSADLNSDREAARMMGDLRQTLAEAGFTFSAATDALTTVAYVTGRAI